jgi:hypothetical protein
MCLANITFKLDCEFAHKKSRNIYIEHRILVYLVGIVMFGYIKNMLGMSEEGADMKVDVVGALESASTGNDVVDTAARLRNLLRQRSCSLTNEDKVRVVRALNKAKVRALMGGTSESYSLFSSLDSISSDVVSLL